MDQILTKLGYHDKIEAFRPLKLNPNSFIKITQIPGGVNNLKSDTGLQIGEILEILDYVENMMKEQTAQNKEDIQMKSQMNVQSRQLGAQVHNNMNRNRVEPQNTFQNQTGLNFETKFGRNNRMAKLITNNAQPQPKQQIQVKPILPVYQQKYEITPRSFQNQRETPVSQKIQSENDKSNQENKQYMINNFPPKQLNQIDQFRPQNQEKSKLQNQERDVNKIIQSTNIEKTELTKQVPQAEQRHDKSILNQHSQEYVFQKLQKHSSEKVQQPREYEYSDQTSNNNFDQGDYQQFNKRIFQEQNVSQNNNDLPQVSAQIQKRTSDHTQNLPAKPKQDEYQVNAKAQDQQISSNGSDEEDDLSESNSKLSEQSIQNTQKQPQPVFPSFDAQNVHNSQISKQHLSRPTIGVKQPALSSLRQPQQPSGAFQNQQKDQLINNPNSKKIDSFEESDENKQQPNNFEDSQMDSNEYGSGDEEDSQFNYDQNENMGNIQNKQNFQESDENNSESNISSAESQQYQTQRQTQDQKVINKDDEKYSQSEMDMPSDSEFNQKTQRLKQQSLWGNNNSQAKESGQMEQTQEQNKDTLQNQVQYYSQEEEGECENSYGDEDQDFENQNVKNNENQFQESEEQSDYNESSNYQENNANQPLQQQVSDQNKNETTLDPKPQTANISEDTFLDGPQYEDEQEHQNSSYQSERNQDQLKNQEFKIPKDHLMKKVNPIVRPQPAQNEINIPKHQMQFIHKSDFLSHLQHTNSYSTNNPELHHLMMQNDELYQQSNAINNIDKNRGNILHQQQSEKQQFNQMDKMMNEFQMKSIQCLDSNITENTFQQPQILNNYYNKKEDLLNQKMPNEYEQNFFSDTKLINNKAALSPSKILNDQFIYQRSDVNKGSMNSNGLHSIDKNESFMKLNMLQNSEYNDQRHFKKIDNLGNQSSINPNLQRNFNLDQPLRQSQQLDSQRKQTVKCDKEINVQEDLLEKILSEAKKQNLQEVQIHKNILDKQQAELNRQNYSNLSDQFNGKLKQQVKEILEAEQEKTNQAILKINDEKRKLQSHVDSGFDEIKVKHKQESEDLKGQIANKNEEVDLLKRKIAMLQNQVESLNKNISSKDGDIVFEKQQKERLQGQLSEQKGLYEQAKDFIQNLQNENREKDEQITQEREQNQSKIDYIQNQHQLEIQQMVEKYENTQIEIQALRQKLKQLQEQYDNLLQVQQKQEKAKEQQQIQEKISFSQSQITKKNEIEEKQNVSQEQALQQQLQQLLQKKRELEKLNQKLFSEDNDKEDVQLLQGQQFEMATQKSAKSNEQVLSQISQKNQNKSKIENQEILILENSEMKQKDEFLSQVREESSYLPEYIKPIIEQPEKKKIIKKVRFHDDEQLANLPHQPLKAHQKVGQKRLRQDIDSDQEESQKNEFLNLSAGLDGSSQNFQREDSNEPTRQYLDQECEKEFKRAAQKESQENALKNKRQKGENIENSQPIRRPNGSESTKEQISHKVTKVYSEDVSDNGSMRVRNQSKRARKPISIKSSSRSASPLPEQQNGSTNGACNSTSAQSQSYQQTRQPKKVNNENNQYGQKMKEHMNSIDKSVLNQNPNLSKLLQKIMKK